MNSKNNHDAADIADTDKDKTPDREKGVIRENFEAIAIALLLALFIRAFLVQPFRIPSGSMENTLLIGDRIFVSKFAYGVRMPFTNKTIFRVGTPKRGDIVVFKYPINPKQDFIKRIIGLPGDKLQMIDRQLFINNQPWEDPYGWYRGPDNGGWTPSRSFGPITVPKNKYFAMGDNRDNSSDSRVWGFLDYEDLRGRALIIYYSRDKNVFDIRWGRTGKALR